MASRLTEDRAYRVLLLEAGGEDDNPAIRISAYYGRLQDSSCDWAYRTVPQENLCGRRLFVPQGRVHEWLRLGNVGWSYDDVLPFFVKSESNQTFCNEYHGNAGELIVASHLPSNPLVERYLTAAQEAGIPFNPDFNGASQEGCGPLQATIAKGARCSAADAFLRPARSRPNLTVLTHAQATRLMFNGTRATGIEYLHFGSVEQAHAAEEVVISAGALRSPNLLMLSGVGPKFELQRLG